MKCHTLILCLVAILMGVTEANVRRAVKQQGDPDSSISQGGAQNGKPFQDLQDAVDAAVKAEKAAREAAIAAEAAARTAADAAEEMARKEAIAAEEDARKIADADLQKQINFINMTVTDMKDFLNRTIDELEAKDDSQDEAQDEIISLLSIALEEITERLEANEKDIDALEIAASLHEKKMKRLWKKINNIENSTDYNLFNIKQSLNDAISAVGERTDMLENMLENRTDTIDQEISDLEQEVEGLTVRLNTVDNVLSTKCQNGTVMVGINKFGKPRCTKVVKSGSMETVTVTQSLNPSSSSTLYCPSGFISSGGGFKFRGTFYVVSSSYPVNDNGWRVSSKYRGDAYVRCLKIVNN
mmetsp:Transcript_23451/g.32883  ORF Transcript_23451/g.32883 Transcript_23451/m.32883 type:complete len:356 (+) Transcript_23451:286-1353(+)